MFLLDTVIVSELRKKKPNAGLVRWVSMQLEDQLYLSVVALSEIERGIEKRRKSDPEFANALAAWLESLTASTQIGRSRLRPAWHCAGVACRRSLGMKVPTC